MPPQTKLRADQVERKLRHRKKKECLPFSHFVDIFGDCECGAYEKGVYTGPDYSLLKQFAKMLTPKSDA